MRKNTPAISIVIPVYNRAKLLKRVILEIQKQTYPNYEIIVVDDNSSDDIAKALDSLPCKIIRNDKNLGPGQCRNIGARAAAGDILFFTDSDVLLPPDALDIVSEELSSPDVDAVVGLLSTKLEYRNFASNYKNLYMHFTYLCFGEHTNVFFTSVAAVKKMAFNAVGGFDGEFGIKPNEDLEIGLRLFDKYAVKSVKRLQVEHVKHYSWKGVLKTDFDRGSSVIRIKLRRRRIKENPERKAQAYPAAFLVGILISAFSLLSIPLSILSPGYLLILPISVLAIMAVNRKFLSFLHSEKGMLFAMKSCLFLYLDILAYGFGVLKGLAGYILGEKY